MDLTTAVASLKTLMLCSLENAFGEKANAMRDVIVFMVASNSLPRDTKDSLQLFLLRLERNCPALKTHKPLVKKYRNLKNNIDSYNSNVLGLITCIDGFKEEYNAPVAKAANLKSQLETTLAANRQ